MFCLLQISPLVEKRGFDRASILTTMSAGRKTSFSYYHSFGLTEHYILFLEQPLLVNTVRMAASGIKGYALKECFDWFPKEKVNLLIIYLVIDLLFCFHI